MSKLGIAAIVLAATLCGAASCLAEDTVIVIDGDAVDKLLDEGERLGKKAKKKGKKIAREAEDIAQDVADAFVDAYEDAKD